MIGKTIEKYSGILYEDAYLAAAYNGSGNNVQDLGVFLSNDINEAKVMIATSLALLVGIIQVSFFKLSN